MELRQTIAERYAAKHFDGRPIPEAQVQELLGLIRLAPSGLNIQPWRVKVVSDPAVKEQLLAASYDSPQITTCSHLLVFCADKDYAELTSRLLTHMEKHGVPERVREIVAGIAAEMGHMPAEAWFAYAMANTYLPAFLTQLVAVDMGFDSCMMTHFTPEEYSRILGIPANLQPVLVCPLGYADDAPPPKWRYDVSHFVID